MKRQMTILCLISSVCCAALPQGLPFRFRLNRTHNHLRSYEQLYLQSSSATRNSRRLSHKTDLQKVDAIIHAHWKKLGANEMATKALLRRGEGDGSPEDLLMQTLLKEKGYLSRALEFFRDSSRSLLANIIRDYALEHRLHPDEFQQNYSEYLKQTLVILPGVQKFSGEISKTQWETPGRGGKVPVVGGCDLGEGKELYLAIVKVQDVWMPGYTREHQNYASTCYGGVEVRGSEYAVLSNESSYQYFGVDNVDQVPNGAVQQGIDISSKHELYFARGYYVDRWIPGKWLRGAKACWVPLSTGEEVLCEKFEVLCRYSVSDEN